MDAETYARLGRALKAERIRLGLTLRELAERVGTESHEWISAIEHGRRRPSIDVLDRLAVALGLRLVVEAWFEPVRRKAAGR